MITGVIIVHSVLAFNLIGVANPYFQEKIFHMLVTSILTNGVLIMQTFFAMSGFLLVILGTHEIKKIKPKDRSYVKIFLKFVILRFVRLVFEI